MSQTIEHSRRRCSALAWLFLAVLIALGGCASLDEGHTSNTSVPAFTSGSQSARDRLNDGYSDLYSSAQGLAQVDKIFYVKIESDDVQRVVEDVTYYSGRLAQRLTSLSADFPALALDRQTTPPLLKAADEAQKKATLKRFAPIVGTSGKAFERGILIRLLGAVDKLHYLAATLAQREPDPALSEIMAGTGTQYADFYDEIDALLNKRFYR